MNEEDNTRDGKSDVFLTALALGEFPEHPAKDREHEEVDATKRIARIVERTYMREPEYAMTDAQRDLVLSGAAAFRAVPAMTRQSRRALVGALAGGIAVAASIFLLLALWPAAPGAPGEKREPLVAEIEPGEGVLMRVQILEKPSTAAVAMAVDTGENDDPREAARELELAVSEERPGGPDSRRESPAVVPENGPAGVTTLEELVGALSGADGTENPPSFDFEGAVEGLQDFGEMPSDPVRWRLALHQSMKAPDGGEHTFQRLAFHGPAADSQPMLVAFKFDSGRVAKFRPVHLPDWTPGAGELVLKVPAGAAAGGQWEILLEVEPVPFPQGRAFLDPKMLGSTSPLDFGDVVVAVDNDQASARLKVTGEVDMTPAARRRLAIARFARWLESRDVSAEGILDEMKDLSGDGFEEIEKRITGSLK